MTDRPTTTLINYHETVSKHIAHVILPDGKHAFATRARNNNEFYNPTDELQILTMLNQGEGHPGVPKLLVNQLAVLSSIQLGSRLRQEGCPLNPEDFSPAALWLVQELVIGSDLETFMQQIKLSYPALIAVATQLADILTFSHNHGVVHGDVSLKNIVLRASVNNTPDVVLVDWSQAKKFNPEQSSSDTEAISPFVESDIRNFAACLCSLACGQVRTNDSWQQLETSNLSPEIARLISNKTDFCDLINQCLGQPQTLTIAVVSSRIKHNFPF